MPLGADVTFDPCAAEGMTVAFAGAVGNAPVWPGPDVVAGTGDRTVPLAVGEPGDPV